MRISESCAKCLYDRQMAKTGDKEYLAEIKALLDNRGEDDTSPYMVYQFNKVYERYFGKGADYSEVKKKYNDLVLGMEDRLREEIEASDDPLAKALMISRIGNYIDFGAMDDVDVDTFLGLFSHTGMNGGDRKTYRSFLNECDKGRTFLLVCDNCGEIVLDKLLLEQLSKRFPRLEFYALVRGKDVLNDATLEDGRHVGLDNVAELISNGDAVAGTIYEMMPDKAKKVMDQADIILAKGQGNYESMTGRGYHVFFEFLCKCDLFMNRFQVPKLTGIFVEERDDKNNSSNKEEKQCCTK